MSSTPLADSTRYEVHLIPDSPGRVVVLFDSVPVVRRDDLLDARRDMEAVAAQVLQTLTSGAAQQKAAEVVHTVLVRWERRGTLVPERWEDGREYVRLFSHPKDLAKPLGKNALN